MASQRWPQNIGKLTKLMKSGTSGLNFSTEIISFVIILLDTDYTLRNDAKTSDLKISYVEHSHQGWFENKVKCVFIRSLSLFLKVFFSLFSYFFVIQVITVTQIYKKIKSQNFHILQGPGTKGFLCKISQNVPTLRVGNLWLRRF